MTMLGHGQLAGRRVVLSASEASLELYTSSQQVYISVSFI